VWEDTDSLLFNSTTNQCTVRKEKLGLLYAQHLTEQLVYSGYWTLTETRASRLRRLGDAMGPIYEAETRSGWRILNIEYPNQEPRYGDKAKKVSSMLICSSKPSSNLNEECVVSIYFYSTDPLEFA
jgi:hypothetical protein